MKRVDNRTIIIAEAGVNHNGSFDKAKLLIDEAVKAEVDYIKFQTFKTELNISKKAKKANYQLENTGNTESQYEMVKKLELSFEQHFKLYEYCKSKGIQYLSTGFDMDSLEFLSKIGTKLAKIPSGEITNLPYLRKVAELFEEVILSTGMADIQEIRDAVKILLDNGVKREKLTILHCNTEYPTPMEDVNLRAMLHIQQELDVKVGYSDHTLGIEVPIAAVTLGATVIEKHFTLDKNLPGPDHKASLEPNELKEMVKSIRNIEKALSGSGVKEPSNSEQKNKPIARKSIVANCFIAKGDVFNENNLAIKRPGTGLSPMMWDKVIGQIAAKDYQEEELI